MFRSLRGRPVLGLIALVILLAARLIDTAQEKSFTAEEPHYVGTGLYLWQTGDYHYANTLRFHLPLAHHLAALPLLAVDLGRHEVGPRLGEELVNARDPSPELVRLLSRLPFIALTCWGAVLVFLWARHAGGEWAGLLAAFLYSFCPTILANGALAHSDITVTVFSLQALYAFWRWWRWPTPVRFALCGVSLGLALLSKPSALLLVATLAILLAAIALQWKPLATGAGLVGPARRFARLGWAAAMFAGMLALAVGVLWLGYGGSLALGKGTGGSFSHLTLPAYAHSVLHEFDVDAGGRTAFLFGQHSERGWWYFIPASFALKAPIALLGLIALATFTLRPYLRGFGAFLIVPILLYALVACFVLRVPPGLRYVLPIFPLLHLFVGARLVPLGTGRRRTLTLSACAWLAATSLWIHPHYLAYFNGFVGGPSNGYRHLAESNLDWGQDLSTLARYLHDRGNPPVRLAYAGPEDPARYELRARPLRGCAPVSGLVAISASVLQGLRSADHPTKPPPKDCYDWLLDDEPIAQPGYSILVYEVPVR